MADQRQEIKALRQKIERANREISDIRRATDAKLQQEVAHMRREMSSTSARMQNDFADKLQLLQNSFSEAYLAETERMRARYSSLMNQVKEYEEKLNSSIQELEEQQRALIQENDRKNRQYQRLALEAVTRLQENIEEACTLPVEVFYPHSIQKYLDAGREAKHLLEINLYSLALAKADCASMAVCRVKEETQSQLDKLEALFEIYKMEYDAIKGSLSKEYRRCLFDGNEVILELSEIDMDYWSDQLYSELLAQLNEHKKTIDMGIHGWIQRCDGQALEPIFLLDKEVQKLELIPQKLSICTSYALSACDCFNYTQTILSEKLEQILSEQNYELSDYLYGACKDGNANTEGFKWYYENFLQKEKCVCTGHIPDYREERIMVFKKRHLYGTDSDSCTLYIVPFRKNNTVAYRIFIKLTSEYIPQMMLDRMITLFEQSGLKVEYTTDDSILETAAHRPLSLQEITRERLISDEACLGKKYSID